MVLPERVSTQPGPGGPGVVLALVLVVVLVGLGVVLPLSWPGQRRSSPQHPPHAQPSFSGFFNLPGHRLQASVHIPTTSQSVSILVPLLTGQTRSSWPGSPTHLHPYCLASAGSQSSISSTTSPSASWILLDGSRSNPLLCALMWRSSSIIMREQS